MADIFTIRADNYEIFLSKCEGDELLMLKDGRIGNIGLVSLKAATQRINNKNIITPLK